MTDQLKRLVNELEDYIERTASPADPPTDDELQHRIGRIAVLAHDAGLNLPGELGSLAGALATELSNSQRALTGDRAIRQTFSRLKAALLTSAGETESIEKRLARVERLLARQIETGRRDIHFQSPPSSGNASSRTNERLTIALDSNDDEDNEDEDAAGTRKRGRKVNAEFHRRQQRELALQTLLGAETVPSKNEEQLLRHWTNRLESAVWDLANLAFPYSEQKATKYRYEVIRVYLQGDQVGLFEKLCSAARQLARSMDCELLVEGPNERGSFFKKMYIRLFGSETQQSIVENSAAALVDLPRANRDKVDAESSLAKAEARKLDSEASHLTALAAKTLAEAKKIEAEALKTLTEAAQNVAHLVNSIPSGTIIQVGGLVVSRAVGEDVEARALNGEIRADWERNSALHRNAEAAHAYLRGLPPAHTDKGAGKPASRRKRRSRS